MRLALRLAVRHGFTLVELLVAVVLLNVGLLALVGASAALVRRHVAVRARSAAVRAASARLELLAASPCVASDGSAARPDGLDEYWSASPPANAVRDIADSVVYS